MPAPLALNAPAVLALAAGFLCIEVSYSFSTQQVRHPLHDH